MRSDCALTLKLMLHIFSFSVYSPFFRCVSLSLSLALSLARISAPPTVAISSSCWTEKQNVLYVLYTSWACGLRKVCKIVGDYFIGSILTYSLSLYVFSYLYYCLFLSLLLTESLNLSHSFSMHTSFYIASGIAGVQLPSYSNSS